LISSELARELAKKFNIFIKALRLYAEGHIRRKISLEEWMEVLERALKEEKSISFFSEGSCLCVQAIDVTEGDEVLSGLARDFIKRYICFFQIRRGVTAEEMLVFAKIFLPRPQDIREQGGPLKFFEKEPLKSIRVVETLYVPESSLKQLDPQDMAAVFEQWSAEKEAFTRSSFLQGLSEERREFFRKLLDDTDVMKECLNITAFCWRLATSLAIDARQTQFLRDLLYDLASFDWSEHFQDWDAGKNVFLAVLRSLHERMKERFVEEEESEQKRTILTAIASRLFKGSPGFFADLLRQSDRATDRMGSSVAELLKGVFPREHFAGKKVTFKEALNTLKEGSGAQEKTTSAGKDLAASKEGLLPAETPVEAIERKVLEMAEAEQTEREIELEAARPIYRRILQEIARVEKDPSLKQRIVLQIIKASAEDTGALRALNPEDARDLLLIEGVEAKERLLFLGEVSSILGVEATVRLYLKGLKAEEIGEAARTLFEVGGAEAVEAVLDFYCEEKSPERKEALASALVWLERRSLSLVEERLQRADESMAKDLFRLLSRMRSPAAGALLWTLAEVGDTERRILAVQALGKRTEPGDIPLLERLLDGRSREVRRLAIFYLGERRDPRAIMSLSEVAEKGSRFSRPAEERILALEALVKIKPEAALPVLRRLVRGGILAWWRRSGRVAAHARALLHTLAGNRRTG